MVHLTILPSPCVDVHLKPYVAADFPKFGRLFDPQADDSHLLRLLGLQVARDQDEVSVALVLENQSLKAITGLGYRWTAIDELGERRIQVGFHDSYLMDVHQAVVEPASRLLITPSGTLDEALIDHVISGGGMISGSVSRSCSLQNAVEMFFEIDLVLFADGEFSGPDTDRHLLQLQSRKRAAEFVFKQIRQAQAEDRDVERVLSALAEIPCLGSLQHGQGDPLVHWTHRYASDYQRDLHEKSGDVDWAAVRLRHLENHPTLPKFYRRQQ